VTAAGPFVSLELSLELLPALNQLKVVQLLLR
jgi:hypothetical protein